MKKLLLTLALLFTLTSCLEETYPSAPNEILPTPEVQPEEELNNTTPEGDLPTPEVDPDQPTPSPEIDPDFDYIRGTDDSTAYVEWNDNDPEFTAEELATEPYIELGELDELGRVTEVEAMLHKSTMPTEERESISHVYPSGWEQEKYVTDLVEGGWLYNRSHMLGFQLTGLNDDKENLMTGTRSFNVDGMLPFENEIASHLRTTDEHVILRVTPVFEGDNLLASGIIMEAESVESKDIEFSVYIYNAQRGIEIDYATGENHVA